MVPQSRSESSHFLNVDGGSDANADSRRRRTRTFRSTIQRTIFRNESTTCCALVHAFLARFFAARFGSLGRGGVANSFAGREMFRRKIGRKISLKSAEPKAPDPRLKP